MNDIGYAETTGRKVLIVNDSQAQAENLRLILTTMGIESELASTGDDALVALQQHSIDLVVSAVEMPGMSGYELCRRVKAGAATGAPPFLMLTDQQDPAEIINGLECGADALLSNPYDAEQLGAKITGLMSNGSLQPSRRFSVDAELDDTDRATRFSASKEAALNLLVSAAEELHATKQALVKSRQALTAAKSALKCPRPSVEQRPVNVDGDCFLRHQAVEALDAGIVIVDVSSQGLLVTDANGAFFRLFGRNRATVIGRPLSLFSGDNTAPDALERICAALVSVKPLTETLRCFRQDGTSFWCEIKLCPMQSQDGGVRHCVVVLSDVSRSMQSQQALAAVSTELYPAEGIEYYRQAALRLAEIAAAEIAFICRHADNPSPDQVVTVALVDAGKIVPDISYPRAGTPCDNLLAGEPCMVLSGAHRCYPDHPLLVAKGIEGYAAEPLMDRNGQIIGHIGIMTPVPLTDSKAIAQTLKIFSVAVAAAMLRERNLRHYQDLFELAADAMVMTDSNGVIRLINRQVEQLFGWSRAELQGQPVEILVPVDGRSRHKDSRTQLKARPSMQKMAADRPDLCGLRKDGSSFPADITLNSIKTDDGLMIVAVVRDISERISNERDRRARLVAEKASEAKSAFLAAMSHEIRTPMNGVMGSVDLLARSSLKPHQVELVETIRDSASSLLTIIDGVLDFSKIEAGRLELEREPVSLCRVVETICIAFKPVALNKGVRLLLFTDPDLPESIFSDAIRLRQILNNLLSNAIKFSSGQGRRGRVLVRAERIGASRVRLSVTDNGIGMGAEAQANLFKPFVQGEVSTTRRFGGSGLGLAICQRLLEMFNGQICVASTPGQGSTFTVTLPVEVEHRVQSTAVAADLRGLHCLLNTQRAEQAQDWCRYLTHAGAGADRFEQGYGMAHYEASLPGSGCQKTGRAVNSVLLFEGEIEAAQRWRASFALQSPPPLVVVGSGHRRIARLLTADVVALDGDAMTQAALLNAVAMATGRSVPEPEQGGPGLLCDAFLPPDRETAIANGRLILVAEDNEVNQKVIRRQLALLGLAAEVVDNGRDALNAWREGGYALLLSDLSMPELDGYELTRAIRVEESEDCHLPIIALTANALKGEADRCRDAGMDDYLSKPATLEQLKSTLEKWLPKLTGEESNNDSAASPPTTAGPAVLDLTIPIELIGDDPSLLDEFLHDFKHSAEEAAAQLRVALAAEDPHAAAIIAHRLKSSSTAMGAQVLASCCEQIEQASKNTTRGNSPDAELIRKFESALSAVFAAIDKLE